MILALSPGESARAFRMAEAIADLPRRDQVNACAVIVAAALKFTEHAFAMTNAVCSSSETGAPNASRSEVCE